MMYSNRFVCAVKVNGQILRENGESVALPFGSEYSILLKNLDTLRSQVKVSVDGQDATEGTSLIVNGGSSLELERFIRGGNLDTGNRFKFIERSAAVERHRGVQADDGLIRVEFQFEVPKPERVTKIVEEHVHHYDDFPMPWYPKYPRPWRPHRYDGPYSREVGLSFSGGSRSSAAPSARPSASTARRAMHPTRARGSSLPPVARASAAPNTHGITVPGSHSQQQFYSAQGFPLQEQKYVIVLKLVGCVKGEQVTEPITVNHKPQCVTCGKSNKGTAQFCSQCGTGLVLV